MTESTWQVFDLTVGATTEHSFFEIEEDMTLLVLFAATPQQHKA